MTLQQTDGIMDVDRPEGERIRVKFRGEAASEPEVASGLVQLLLEASGGNIYEAVTNYADGFGLGATYYLGTEWVMIELYDPPTLTPLVNASGGSPQSSAGRVLVARSLSRLRRHRAPTGS